MNISSNVKKGLVSATALMAGSQMAAAQSWDGSYIGLSVGTMKGAMPWEDGPSYDDYVLSNEATFGAFYGHNTTLGNGLVLGTEFALQTKTNGDVHGNSSSPEEYNINALADAKLKLGKSFSTGAGDVLAYGFAGVSAADIGIASGGTYSAFGANIGLGADLKLGANMSVGAELIHRSMNGYGEDGNLSARSEHNELSLRAAFHF